MLWTYLKDRALVYSDLHLTIGERPAYRDRAGRIVKCPEAEPITAEDIAVLLPEDTSSLTALIETHEGEANFAATVDGVRYRVNGSWHDGHRLGVVMRRVNDTIPPLNELGLPLDIINTFLARSSGIVQITGATGSGKSTTMAAMIATLCREPVRIVTLEDPIEYLLPRDQAAVVTQREVGHDTPSFSLGIRAAMRQDPDILVIGEVRDAETAEAALQAADTGHLVFTTAHTRSAARTVERIQNLFPAERQGTILGQFADAFLGVISQVLVPSADGQGKVLAYEVMTPDGGVAANIRKNRIEQLNNDIDSGGQWGMVKLNKTLARLVREGRITKADALGASYEPQTLKREI